MHRSAACAQCTSARRRGALGVAPKSTRTEHARRHCRGTDLDTRLSDVSRKAISPRMASVPLASLPMLMEPERLVSARIVNGVTCVPLAALTSHALVMGAEMLTPVAEKEMLGMVCRDTSRLTAAFGYAAGRPGAMRV